MNNTFYIARNAETTVDMDTPVSKWLLSTEGRQQTEKLAGLKVDAIASSDEIKAVQTAEPLSRKLDLHIDKYPALRELNRDRSPPMDNKTWNFGVKYAMKNPDKSKFEWEKASSALARFSEKIQELDLAYNKRRILVVSHGIVVSMYFAQLLGKLHAAFERMQNTPHCAYGVVRDGKVVKDII